MKNPIPVQPPSCDETDPDSLTVDQARQRLAAEVTPLTDSRELGLSEALHHVLAEAVISPIDVPPCRNSAMDGYAVRSADLPGSGESMLAVVGTSWAGRPFEGKVAPGQCVRIMTGARLPAECDTVIMQEHVQREGEVARFGPGHCAGQNVRQAGEDIARGSTVLESGKLLRAAELGLLASLGVPTVRVLRKPVVAFFSTGDELKAPGEPLEDGQIYDSNRYILHGLLRELDVEPLDLGVIPDEREAVEAAFRDAAGRADAVITSGGVSVGEADFVKETLERIGEVNFWKIAMKPGKPLAFGRIDRAWFFGLPGNPVSVLATWLEMVKPALRRLRGETPPAPLSIRVPCSEPLKKRPGRVDFQRGILETGADGQLQVRGVGMQASHILSGMSRANCFIVLPREAGNIEAGELVEVQPFEGLL